ncbi:MFS transporter [Nostoc parmelioides]|uniref:MFS transporter n=1 Tax=Nostoc parmelioides FACHB-3921 TaxID=2692909 RepID=A0ABR8B8Z1_9NOSO|nr:MFS transporter [Nostoc parmelioides]MBD2250291.1 MFS transporter [Nostoc parmelioides FACHB-3921]
MFYNLDSFLIYSWLSLGIAGTNKLPEVIAPSAVPISFSGTKILVALLAGTLMAIAFHLLLTNLSVAVGISTYGKNPYSDDDDDSESLGKQVREVEAKVGSWAIVTASIALFAATFLAVKLSLIGNTTLGVISGVVIWSTYFFLIIWLGSSAVGSFLGSIISTVSSGLQALTGTATSAIGAATTKSQMVSTAEDITAAVRRELTAGFDQDTIRNTLQSSLSKLQVPALNLNEIRSQFDKILGDVDWQSLGDGDLLKNVNRQTFVDLISDRTNLSPANINQIADQLQAAWQQVANRKNPTEQVINLLQSATPEELKSEDLGERLQQLVTSRKNGNGRNGMMQQAVKYGISAAVPAVLDRVDISDIDVERITNQLQQLRDKVQDIDVERITKQLQQIREKTTEQISHRFSPPSDNTIKTDVEDYIRNSFPWHFNRLTIRNEFQDVIYDPQADPTNVRQQIEQLNPDDFTNWLTQRGDLTEAKVKEIAQDMENIRQQVLETVQQSEKVEKGHEIRNRIENYLRATGKPELNSEAIDRDFGNLLTEAGQEFADISTRLQGFDREAFVQVLLQRQDFSEEEANNIVSQLESIRDNFLTQARETQEQATTKANELWQRVEEYLRHTRKEELNPDAIKRDLRVLLEDPQVGINLLRSRLSQFDRDTLVQLLNQRQDLSEEQINQIIDQVEAVRDSVLQAPQAVVDQAKAQYEKTTTAIADYLRNTNLEELNPEGIRQDLATLLSDPKEGAVALRHRLSQIDRETLVKILSQQQNLSEDQVNQIIDQLQDAIGDIIRTPRRFAKRATQKIVDFEAGLEDYLRQTNKEELNPEGIKRDLQLLLRDPRLGIGSLGDRVSQFDRATIVALLSQREDISEEEANRIADQIESVRSTITEQVQQIQHQLQSAIDQVFDRIRNYLNSLDRPELNYESIRQDFAKLFDDPQAGFEALGDRLSQFDRDTLVAVLSSREDISREDVNRIIDQIEAARDSVLHRAGRIQQEAQKRIKAVRQQAKKQVEETRKTVASAAWWLFGAAFSSLAASAIAGALAVAN